jgi:outer membrane biosynthesis protein TonB
MTWVQLRRLFWPVIAGCCLLVCSGCVRAHAKTAPALPDAPLAVPPPPERNIETADVETPPPPPEPAPEPTRTQPPRPRPAPAREQPRAEPKPEPPPAEAPKPAEEAPRGASSTLQTTPATVEGERGVRATLTRATNELNRIDYRSLNADAKIQYDTAKRFIRQADDAMRSKNLVFAKNLADKAATIADQLAGR